MNNNYKCCMKIKQYSFNEILKEIKDNKHILSM